MYTYIYLYTHTKTHKYKYIYIHIYGIFLTGPSGQWPGRPGFNPRSSHTKDFKNGT